jgi:hypothetical protein
MPFPSGTATLHCLLTTAFGAGTTFALMLYARGQQGGLFNLDVLQAAIPDTGVVTLFGFYFGLAGLWWTRLAYQWANTRWRRKPQLAKLIPFAAIWVAFTLLEGGTWWLHLTPNPRNPILGHLLAILLCWELASFMAGLVVVRSIPKTA